ncbi:hypothetical protein SAMN05518801_101343 [Novosphingobium sp. CF614]|uniref:hypothetical protein n=1 Tax=Novosphingobium sp. CF614 TaxID=1884364 RepID=UPI0008EEDCA0|nr:hypothetical protein [Novosphingobium sp. CF614]SFF76445.1 hypothetical protein SAMN05518801_101343 [Novosphingobium sp. CF614]
MLRGAQLSIRTGFITHDPVPQALIDAITELQITRQSPRGGFQMKLRLAKGGPVETEMLPGGMFTPGKRFIFSLMIDGVRTVLLDGFVARYDVAQANDAGKATLSVTGGDVTQLMDQYDITGLPMPGMPPMGQVAFILARWTPLGVIPAILPPPSWTIPNPVNGWHIQQGTDYGHVNRLARACGYVFLVEPTEQEGVTTAYWGPDLGGLTPGGNFNSQGLSMLPALTVNMDQASNVETLSFSFDGTQKLLPYLLSQEIRATGLTIPIPIPGEILSPPMGPGWIPYARFSKLADLGRNSDRETQARLDIPELVMRGLGEAAQASRVIGASGTLDLARYGRALVPGRLVPVRGAGPHHDGVYLVKSVTTSIKRGSLKQNFQLSKNAHGSYTQEVAA